MGIRSPGAGFTSCQTWVLPKSSQHSHSLSRLCSLLVPGFNKVTKPSPESSPSFSFISYVIALPDPMPISQHSINTYQITNKNEEASLYHSPNCLTGQSSQIKRVLAMDTNTYVRCKLCTFAYLVVTTISPGQQLV